MPDSNDGFSLAHPCGLHIRKDLLEPDVRVVRGVTSRDHRNGYVWYYLPRAQIAGQDISMGLCFFRQQLAFIHLAVVNEPHGAGSGDWSQLKEQARAEATGRWLADVGYPAGTYPWGVVHAGIDAKTGDGSGGVRFLLDTEA